MHIKHINKKSYLEIVAAENLDAYEDSSESSEPELEREQLEPESELRPVPKAGDIDDDDVVGGGNGNGSGGVGGGRGNNEIEEQISLDRPHSLDERQSCWKKYCCFCCRRCCFRSSSSSSSYAFSTSAPTSSSSSSFYGLKKLNGLCQKSYRSRWCIGVSLLIAIALIITMIAIFAQAMRSNDNNNNDDGDTKQQQKFCTSKACIAMANDILSGLNEKIDPCEDFYQFTCGGWIHDNSWALINTPEYNQFDVLEDYLKTVFLDALFYDVDKNLVNHSAVQKATTFYQRCYDSTIEEEALYQQILLKNFIQAVNFNGSTSNSWDAKTIKAFTQALSWLTVRDWNDFFYIDIWNTRQLIISQNAEFWLTYQPQELLEWIEVLTPVYVNMFQLTESEARKVLKDVIAFFDTVYSYSTITKDYLSASYLLQHINTTTTISTFGNSTILNFSDIVITTFETTLSRVNSYWFVGPDLGYFNQLIPLFERSTPRLLQYVLYTDVLVYGLNYANFLEQSRYMTRADYCYKIVTQEFPYVFGYIIEHMLYSDEKKNHTYKLAKSIKGKLRQKIADYLPWMDDPSRDNSLEKLTYLDLHVGFPPQIMSYEALDRYYQPIYDKNTTGKTHRGDSYIDWISTMSDFDVSVKKKGFNGELYDMIAPWPYKVFQSPSSYQYWLTGVNAFYIPDGNWLSIPVTITQAPFYHRDYPDYINYGGLGSIIGHELSHGFDTQGSTYDYNGTHTRIWTDGTYENYSDIVNCFIDSYNNIEIEPGIQTNGDITKDENIADNGGVSISLAAWEAVNFRNQWLLPGLESYTINQLFWISYARLWCDISVPTYYANWTNVHSPGPVRVKGVVQNNAHFAKSFKCPANSPMNPKNKCTLW